MSNFNDVFWEAVWLKSLQHDNSRIASKWVATLLPKCFPALI